MWGIEPQTFHMQSERSTTELHPLNEYLLFHVLMTFVDKYIRKLLVSEPQ